MTLARWPLLILALASLGAAPKPPPIEDPQGAVVPELVVRARTPGPPWWRVSSGSSTVWVLGVPGALPNGQAWDPWALQRRLAKASRLILPPTASFGLLDVFGAFSLSARLRQSTPFEATCRRSWPPASPPTPPCCARSPATTTAGSRRWPG